MYSKIVRAGKKKYKYYHHNVKINGRVKNIFLGSSRIKALAKLKTLRLKRNSIHYRLLKNAPAPHSILNYNKVYI